MTTHALQALVVGDAWLRDEIAAGLAGAGQGRTFLRLAEDVDDAIRLLRQRGAELVVFDLSIGASALRGLAASVRSLSPEAVLVGAEPGPGDPPASSEALVEAVRSRLDDMLARPVSSDAMREVLAQIDARREASSTRSGRVLAFHSTKGGVGKSTLSINTAVGLALRHPDEVLLLDCSLQLGVCASALDLAPEHSLATAARELDRLDARMLRELSTLHPRSGLRLLSAPNDAIDASDVDDRTLAQVISIARRSFRFVVVDTLPIVDAVMLAVFDLADRVYLVNQGTVPDVIGAARLREVLDRIEIPAERTRIVLNRTMSPFPGQLEREEIGRRIGRPVDFEVPFERRVLSALNLGEPCLLAGGRRGWWAALNEIVEDADALTSADDAAPPLSTANATDATPALAATENDGGRRAARSREEKRPSLRQRLLALATGSRP